MIQVVCWSLIPTITNANYQSNSLIWFICLYGIAGYLRIYGLNPKLKSKHYFEFGIFFSLLTYLSSVIFCLVGEKWDVFASYTTYFYGQEKVSVLLISLSWFMGFANI